MKDSKCDYPAACNSMETLLIHKAHRNGPLFDKLCEMLRIEGVSIMRDKQFVNIKCLYESLNLTCTTSAKV